MTDDERQATLNAAIRTTIESMRTLPAERRSEYLTGICTTAISLMHGMLGKEFTRGYLTDALASLDDPTTVILREPRKH